MVLLFTSEGGICLQVLVVHLLLVFAFNGHVKVVPFAVYGTFGSKDWC